MTASGARVLIVDDEKDIVEELSEYLTEEGFCVAKAYDGKAALEALESFRPRVMVLDMKLPMVSGIDILRKTKESYPDTRVIVCTGYVDPELLEEVELLGHDGYLQKPFDLEGLHSEITRLSR